jgi:hypothetical protein
MSRVLSMNARAYSEAQYDDDTEVVLLHFEHPELDAPVRLSTDPTTRISADPLSYGTYSSWLTDDGSPFLFVLLSALVPDDLEDSPPVARLVIEAVDVGITEVLRSLRTPAIVSMAVVLASDPDFIEAEFRNMEMIDAEGNSGQITLTLARDPLTSEPSPPDRMTRARFPGLHR